MSNCRTNLIVDSPAVTDAFGPHDRVARSLADMITSQEGGNSVALEGGWGAGKSTVVRLLQSHLANDAQCTLVVFDAWAHQGDPLRRTFLESLIRHLQRLKWIIGPRWDERLEALAQRRKVTHTKNIPVLTTAGRALGLAAFLVAPGAVLLNAGLRAEEARWFFYVIPGVLLTLSPLVVLLVAGFRAGTEESWALFVQKQISDVHTETVETPEPTSLEFEHTFAELMEEALADRKRRLAVVVDNLDRVAPEDARSVWATLQTFLQRAEHRAPDWLQQVWIVVPFDRSGLRRIWKTGHEEDLHRGGLAESFIDKTFQVRFEIPAPVLSHWRPYLVDLLKTALPDHDEAQFHDAYRLFELRRRTQGTPPTPRDLKLYVNEIGAIHRQWQDAYPLSDVAYYVLLRRDGIDVAADLRARTVPAAEVISLLSGKVRDHLAALAFNVDVALGRQLLLQEPVVASLSDGSSSALRELADNFPGFWEVLENVLDGQLTDWATNSPVNLANAARAFAESGILQSTGHASSRSARKALRAAVAKVTSWTRLDAGTGSGMVALCQLVSDHDAVKQLLKSLSASSIAEEETADKGVKATDWVDAAHAFVRGLRGTAMEPALVDGVTIPGSTSKYLEACSHLAKVDPNSGSWPHFRAKPTAAEVAKSLVETIKKGQSDLELADIVRVVSVTRTEMPWPDVVQQVNARLNPGNALQGDEVVGLLKILWELEAHCEPAKKTLGELAGNGHLHHHLNLAVSQGHNEAKAWMAFTVLTGQPAVPAPPGTGNSAAGHSGLLEMVRSNDEQLAGQLLELALRYEGSGWFFRVLDAGENATQITTQCLRKVAETDSAPQVFRPELILKWWEYLRTNFGEGFVPLLKRLVDQTQLVPELLSTKFEPPRAGFYIALVQAGLTSHKEFVAWCINGLKDVATETWTQQLKAEGELIDLVIALINQKVEVALVHPYEDALHECARSVLNEGWAPKRPATQWSGVFGPLRNPSIRKTLRGRLYDLVQTREGDIPAGFFDLFGSEFGDHEALEDNKRAVSQIFSPLLMKRNTRGLRWLRESLAFGPELLRNFPANELDDFKGRVAEAVQKDPGDEASADVLAIARALGVDVAVTRGGADASAGS